MSEICGYRGVFVTKNNISFYGYKNKTKLISISNCNTLKYYFK